MIEKANQEFSIELPIGTHVPNVAMLHNLQCAALVGSLTGNLGHDIRNLIMPALLRLDVIGLSPELNDTTRRDLDSIRKNISRLQHLADGLRLFEASPFDPSGASERTNIVDWWRGMQMVVASVLPTHTDIRVDMPTSLSAAAVPTSALAHVVLGITLNAKRALTGAVLPTFTLRVRQNESELLLHLTDNGSGLTPAAQTHCFEPFFTTHAEEGARGLALFTSRAIMRRYGGDVEVADAEHGEGTTMIVRMPREAGDALVRDGNRRVRIQVTDARQAAVLRLLLSQDGFRIVSGEESGALHAEICDAVFLSRLLATGPAVNAQNDHPPRIVVIGQPSPELAGRGIDVQWIDPKDLSLVVGLLQ